MTEAGVRLHQPVRPHVSVQMQADVPEDDDWLAPEEAAVLAGLRFAKRRSEWRLGRWTAKLAIGNVLRVPARSVRIEAAEDGAPEAFVHGRPAPVVLSITHREGVGACAVAAAGTAVGCDLETVEPRTEGFVADYFTPAEVAHVRAADTGGRPLVVALIWSAKESALKALRTGLRSDTREVEATFPKGGPPGAPAEGSAAEGWGVMAVRERSAGRDFAVWWRREGDLVLTVATDDRP